MTAPAQMTLEFLGAKPGYVRGSMGAGLDTVTLATADHDFMRGDRVIVEIGGEAGAGARATVGVGGTWPEHSFADEATLLASGAPAWSTVSGDPVAYAQSTGRVARYDGGWSFTYFGNPLLYTQRLFLPRALEAVVIAVDGAQLTLDRSSAVATSNAKVWYDNRDALEQALRSPEGSVRIAADENMYACRSKIITGDTDDNIDANGMTLFGDSSTDATIYQPKGCAQLRIDLHDSADITVRDLGLVRTWIDGAVWNGDDGFTTIYPPILIAIGNTCHRPRFQNLRLQDGVFSECTMSLCSDGSIEGCAVVRTEVARNYASWAFQLADCTNCHIVNCTGDSDAMFEACEIFQGVDCSIVNFSARNGVMASNSNDTPEHDGIYLTYEAGCMALRVASDPSYTALAYPFNHNNNFVLSTAEGGFLKNARFIVQGDVGGVGFGGGYAHHSALPEAGEPFTIGPNVEFQMLGVRAIVSESSPTQELIVDGVTADGLIKLRHATIANTVAPELLYCSDNVTIGSGNVIPIQTDECA